MQGDEQLWKVSMRLGGRAGPIRLTVTDTAGPGDSASLAADELDLELQPGPATQLMVEGPACMEAGTRAVLGELRLKTCDAYGNATTCTTCEVSPWIQTSSIQTSPQSDLGLCCQSKGAARDASSSAQQQHPEISHRLMCLARPLPPKCSCAGGFAAQRAER